MLRGSIGPSRSISVTSHLSDHDQEHFILVSRIERRMKLTNIADLDRLEQGVIPLVRKL